MRVPLAITLLVLTASPAGPGAVAQTVRCQLAPSQYVLRGACWADPTEPRAQGGLSSFWPSDSVQILMTAGPREPPPWRGNISLPGLELSFEVAREHTAPDRSRVVLRTGLFWLVVTEWLPTDRGGASLVFGLTDHPGASADDVAILDAALAGLDSIPRWDREDDRDCANDEPGTVSLFCLLQTAIEARMGRYHHRQPALELLRGVIVARWRDRMAGHPLMDFNNHPATTLEEMRSALEAALVSARAQAASGR
jgi:hypothetical protein